MNDTQGQTRDVPEGFKITDVNVIPEDWVPSRLGECGVVVMGQSPPGASYNRLGRGVPLLNGPTEFTDRYPIKMQWTTAPARFCTSDDLLICVRGSSTGRTNYADGTYAIGRGVAAIRAQSANDTTFLSYRVVGAVSEILAAATGSTFPSVDGATFQRIFIPLPPPHEQRAIAEALSDVDGLIGALTKLIAKKRAIKQAAMEQLLTGKTRLPGFSGKWETLPLREGVTLASGHHVLAKYCNTRGEGVPYLTGPADFPNGQIVLSKHTTKPGALCASGDILVTVKGSGAGTLVVADASYSISRQLMAITVQAWDSRFVFSSLLQNATKLQAASTGLIPGLSRSDILGQDLPLPVDRREQIGIAAVLSDMDAEIEALERRRDKTEQIKQGMMQQLLTGRIRLVKPQAACAKLAAKPKAAKAHNKQINEAVVISVLAKRFGSEQYPLGRMRYTKLSYLLHRYSDKQVEDYQKKAAGPYNPRTRYGGPEEIAVQRGYVREHQSGDYRGFVAAENIAQAEGYFDKWYGADCLRWLERFRRKKNDDLELLTTVDMTVEELRAAGKDIDMASVKQFIGSHPEWKAKLDRPVFSDGSIARAIETCRNLFG